MSRQTLIVLRKELRDALRDKRSLRLVLLTPVFMVGFFALTIGFTIHMSSQEQPEIELPVSGMERAPGLMQWLAEQQIHVREIEGDAYAQVSAGELSYALVVPDSEPVTGPYQVWLIYDAANQVVHRDLWPLRQSIQQYNSREASVQVLARGLSAQLLNPVLLREANVASEQQMGGMILSGLPMLLLMCAMVSSMGFAADMTAGERERRSLEALLINPVSAINMMLGKWLTALTLTLVVVLLSLALLGLALYLLPFDRLGVRVSVDLLALSVIFMVLVPISALAVGLQLLMGVVSRSFKDAQTFMSLLMLLPMVSFFIMLMNPDMERVWHVWLPLLGQQMLVKDILLGETLAAMAVVACWLSAVPLTLLTLWLAARQLQRAKIIYG